jgi:DNA-binding Lrp family transcriptional regulator
LLNPFSFKLFPAIVLMEMESAEAMQNLLERFKDCPRVVHIFKTIGGYNLIALVVAEDQIPLKAYP